VDPRWFRIQLGSAHYPGPLLDSQIVFHAVNKSGSLCMANVLRESYFKHGRSSEFQSFYHKPACDLGTYRERINRSEGHVFFVAHYLYGAVEAPKENRVIISQMRHPVPRAISCYQWLRNKHVAKSGNADDFPTLEEYVINCGGKAHSQLLQFGAGFGADSRELAKATCRDLLLRSQERIERDLRLVGIAERFEESIFLFAHLCGLPAVSQWRQDTRNKDRPLVSETPTRITNLIAEIHHEEIALYTWAKERFEHEVAAADIAGDLEEYKAACAGEYKERVEDFTHH
jgi:hypothetical protein